MSANKVIFRNTTVHAATELKLHGSVQKSLLVDLLNVFVFWEINRGILQKRGRNYIRKRRLGTWTWFFERSI